MPNPLFNYVNALQTVDLYQKIVQQISQDQIIFNAMHHVAQQRGFPFDLPIDIGEFPLKHQEIELSLSRYQNFPNKQGLFFDLVDEIQAQLKSNVLAVYAERLRNVILLKTSQDFSIALNGNDAWQVEWTVTNPNDTTDERKIPVVVHENGRDVINWTVLQYINGGILLYKQRSYATSLALLSIAVEATLRDLLFKKGYTFIFRANKENIYKYSDAKLNVSDDCYTISFPVGHWPNSPADLSALVGGALPINIQVRREIKPDNGRVDLRIKAPIEVVDHLSFDDVETQAVPKNIGSLEEALHIARHVEKVITPVDLPIDIDKVITAVRNKLIHLSNYSMDEELPSFANESPTGRFTVKDFVEGPKYVFDLVLDIPRFVNAQYAKP
jgi:hypothetical protein